MKFLTLDMIKQQLRLDDTQLQLEKELLEMYGDAAEEAVLNLCRRTMEDVVETYGQVPAPMLHATLLLVDNAYKERSPGTTQNLSAVPYSLDLLLKPYMRLAY